MSSKLVPQLPAESPSDSALAVVAEAIARSREATALDFAATRHDLTALNDAVNAVQRIAKDTQASASYARTKLMALGEAGRQRRPIVLGDAFMARCLATAFRYTTDGGSIARAERYEALAVEKAASGPATTVNGGWASELITAGVVGFVLSLQRQSAYASLIARAEPLTLDGGQFKIPIAGEVTPAWVGEGDAIPLGNAVLTVATTAPAKLGAIVTFSEELAKSSNFEALLRRMLARGIASALDLVVFDQNPASATRPAGLLNGVAVTTPSSLATPTEAMRQDLESLVKALDGPVDPVFVMAPSRRLFAVSTLPAGFDYPVLASTAISSDVLICVDASAIAGLHSTTPEITGSQDASVSENIPPGAIIAGGQARSMWQSGVRGLRVILDVAFAGRPGCASWTTPVAW